MLYFANFNKIIKIFFGWINPNKFTTKFFLYWFLPFCFIVNRLFHSLSLCPCSSTSIATFGKTLCFMKSITSSAANTVIIFVSTDCSWVIIGSCCLNPNLVLKFTAGVVLQG